MDGLLLWRFGPLVFGEIPGFTLPVALEPWGGFPFCAAQSPGCDSAISGYYQLGVGRLCCVSAATSSSKRAGLEKIIATSEI
jgi:hypothetical protein